MERLCGSTEHLTLPLPNIESLAASLRGRQLPGGSYRISLDDSRIVASMCAGTGGSPHPVFACVVALRGLGVSIDELCRLCEFELAHGPMLGECQLEFRRPLQADINYTTSVIIDDLVRSTGHASGTMDRLRFSVTFNQLDAGGGEIQLRQEKQTDGRDVFRFIGKARTSEWVDYLYKRRDSADAIFSVSDYSPFSFLLLSREGDRRREYEVRYDPQTKTLVGSVKRKSRVREQSYPVGNVYDPVSALYRIRSRNLSPGTSIETQIFTGKALYRFVAQVVEKETIEVDGRKRPALRLHPEVYSLEKDTHENILPQETTLWVSADPLHIPLKLESGTMWGWIVVELDKRSFRAE